MKVLLSGANGFVGSNLVKALRVNVNEWLVRRVVRSKPDCLVRDEGEYVHISKIDCDTDWCEALKGIDMIVHLAARVHVMSDNEPDPLQAFRAVNVDGTLNLARQAAEAGVKRFVFVSSVKVNGEAGRFSEDDAPNPQDPYGVSKREAEDGLRRLAAQTGMEVVMIRPPLVYGPGVKANFQLLIKIVAKGIPLPLGGIKNRRSLVAVDNLVDFIIICLTNPRAANETFFVSDGDDLSTPELIRRIAKALGKPARLLPVPESVIVRGAGFLGKRAFADRLCGSLQVDISKARTLLDWRPPVTVDEALERTVADFRK